MLHYADHWLLLKTMFLSIMNFWWGLDRIPNYSSFHGNYKNILFVAFHSNPIGRHLNAYRTFHRLRLRYYWPGMYTYVKKMCSACPGCALLNPTKAKLSELAYNFPIEAPFLVLHVDAYKAGAHLGFEGSETYLVACCGMCTFSTLDPLRGPALLSLLLPLWKSNSVMDSATL